MTNREIAFHLVLLALLLLAGSAFYTYQKSAAMVPALVVYLDSASFRERQAAMGRLRELGSAARPASKRLLALTEGFCGRDAQSASGALARIDLVAARQVVERARVVLSEVAGPAAADLSAKSVKAELDTRRRAAEILGGYGFLARPAVPELLAAAQGSDSLLRDRALGALGRIGVPPEDIVPVLLAALADPVQHVRYTAVVALENMPSTVAASAIPALKALSAQAGSLEAQRAKYAAQRLAEPRDARVEIDVARYTLGGRGDIESRLYTLQRLAVLGAAAAPLVGELTGFLDAPEDIVRLSVIETLAAIGPAAHSALPALHAIVGAGDTAGAEAVIADAARYALGRIGVGP